MAATGICRNSVDTAGGALISSQSSVKANGENVIVNDDNVTPHGDSLHNDAKMIAGSNNVFVGGIAVCNAEDLATCGHNAAGSSNVNVGN
tara:strand:+ start:745 stop:1014 length:270 start_codon:yes stop_codon:yes gene_type:complete